MRTRIAAIAAIVVTLAVAVAAALPEHKRSAINTQGVLHPYIHLVVYALIAWLSAWSTPSIAKRVAFCAAIVVFGCATEYVEASLYHGLLEWTDMVLDAMGAVAGTSLGALTVPRERTPARHRLR